MATSGSSNFTTTRDEIIRHALMHMGILGANETASSEQTTDMAHMLNAMVKAWQGRGMHIWSVVEGTLFPQPSQYRYQVGTSSTDHVTETYYDTTLSADEASGQTILSVTSTDDMTVADHIGIVLDDGTLHWSTIASKTSTTVTINDAIDDDAASGNKVFNYTSKLVQPLRVVDYRRYDIDGDTDTPILDIARLDYNRLPNKTSAGSMSQVFYDRQLSMGYLNVWQVPSTVSELLKFTCHKPLQDFDASSDNPDLAQEWILAIEFNLAVVAGTQFGVATERYRRLEARAVEYLDAVIGLDQENQSIFDQPDI